MPLYLALKVPLCTVKLISYNVLLIWYQWLSSANMLFHQHRIWKNAQIKSYFKAIRTSNWKINMPGGIISMDSISSVFRDNISKNKFSGFSWCFNCKFLRFRYCKGMSLVQMRQKALHSCQFISKLKRANIADPSNFKMTHKLPDRVFTEINFSPQV